MVRAMLCHPWCEDWIVSAIAVPASESGVVFRWHLVASVRGERRPK